MISFGPTEEQELIRETLREFAASELREAARPSDEANRVPDELLEKAWELGVASAAIPTEFGGDGTERSPITNAIILEELGHGCVSLAAAALSPSLFIHPLVDFGTEEQKREYLPLFTTSKYHAASLAFHEPSSAAASGWCRWVTAPATSWWWRGGERARVWMTWRRSSCRATPPD